MRNGFGILFTAVFTLTAVAATKPAYSAEVLKVGLVADSAGLNDRSFNQISYEGLRRAEKELGIKATAVVAKNNNEFFPSMDRLARGGYGLIIGVGFYMADPIKLAAEQYPETKFLLIDVPVDGGQNLASAVFASNEIAFLAGALAAMVDQDKSVDLPSDNPIRHNGVLSIVAGAQIPPVDFYMAGFFQGARRVNPEINVLYGYAGTFGDPAMGKQLALAQHSKGSDIVYQLAGGTGLGVIQAAKESKFLAVGVDSDQAYLAPDNVLTSTSKRCDVAVYNAVKDLLDGKFKPGVSVYSLKNGGVEISPPLRGVPQSILDRIEALKQEIIEGKITVSAEIPEWAKKQ